MLPSELSKLIIHPYNLTLIKFECSRELTWRDRCLEHRFAVYCVVPWLCPQHHRGTSSVVTGLAGL